MRHQLEVQALRVREGKQLLVEAVDGSGEADPVLAQALDPVAYAITWYREGGGCGLFRPFSFSWGSRPWGEGKDGGRGGGFVSVGERGGVRVLGVYRECLQARP